MVMSSFYSISAVTAVSIQDAVFCRDGPNKSLEFVRGVFSVVALSLNSLHLKSLWWALFVDFSGKGSFDTRSKLYDIVGRIRPQSLRSIKRNSFHLKSRWWAVISQPQYQAFDYRRTCWDSYACRSLWRYPARLPATCRSRRSATYRDLWRHSEQARGSSGWPFINQASSNHQVWRNASHTKETQGHPSKSNKLNESLKRQGTKKRFRRWYQY